MASRLTQGTGVAGLVAIADESRLVERRALAVHLADGQPPATAVGAQGIQAALIPAIDYFGSAAPRWI
jgi:hypothetical protein